MGFFDNKEREREDWAIIERLLYIIETQAETIRKCCCKAHKVNLVYNFSNNKNTITMVPIADVTLVLGGPNKTGTPELIDNVTQQPVAGVTYSNMAALVQDQTVALVSIDPVTGIAIATPVKVGVTTVVISGNAAFNDSNGQAASGPVQTAQMTLTVTTAADGTTLIYTWS